MDRKPLQSTQGSKLPQRVAGTSKIPGPTPNRKPPTGILKGTKRDASDLHKENVAIQEPPPKKPSYMRPTQSRSAARKSLARARRSIHSRNAASPGKVTRRAPLASRTAPATRAAPRTTTTRPAVSRPGSRAGSSLSSRAATTRKAPPPPATEAPPAETEGAPKADEAEFGSRVRLTAEGKIIVKGVKKYDTKERMKVLEIVLAEKIIETRNNKNALAALTAAFETIKTEKTAAVEETKELSEYKKIKEQECANFEEQYQNSLREVRRLKNDLDSTQEHLDNTTKRLKTERLEKEELQADFDGANKKISNLNVKIENLTAKQKELYDKIDELETLAGEQRKKLEDADDERRLLHETIQQLKGNIRVFARVRPLLPAELQENHTADHITFDTNMDKGIEIEREDKKDKSEFEFDKVFQPGSTQLEVFEEVEQLVRSSLDGYNVCIFAYGQTGSGKTFSMEGPENVYDEPEMTGIIPRSFEYLIETVEKAKEKGWSYTLEAAYLEVYCEELRDLIATGGGNEQDKKLKIEGAGKKHVNVANLTRIQVESKHQILNLIKRANKRRATASTNVNLRSSRSHSVFILFISGQNERTGVKVESCLNLVDLAGSERVKESGATGQRFEEAKKINGSLSSLGDVIAALGSKSKHIPYRNSKLTHLLQNSIGGNSKTLMIMHLNPRKLFANESLNTLRFAQKVNNTNIGTAQKVVK